MNDGSGGSAFPRPDDRGPDGTGIRQGSDGMSLRDWFAGQALAGLCANNGTRGLDNGPDTTTRRAFELADAMLNARR